jgi:hypothetical protein
MNALTSETITVGDFIISVNTDKDFVWIGTPYGEGGSFPIEQIEELIRNFYEENF